MEILMFTKANCNPCEQVKNFIKIVGLDKSRMTTVRLEEDDNVFEQYDIMSTPTLVLLDENGEEVERASGMNPPKIMGIFEKANQD